MRPHTYHTFSDFLDTLDERSFFTPPTSVPPQTVSSNAYTLPATSAYVTPEQTERSVSVPNILPAPTKTEKFLLTAADQAPGSRNQRLSEVIRSKYEAGLLRPYNYVKGYARLSRWMDRKFAFHFVSIHWHADP